MEYIIHAQVYVYVSDNNIIADEQARFRKGHSMVTSLIDFLANNYLNIDRGCHCGVLILNPHKAFDTVNHRIWVMKLQKYGFKSSSAEWFRLYLRGRKQVTKVGRYFWPHVGGMWSPKGIHTWTTSIFTRHEWPSASTANVQNKFICGRHCFDHSLKQSIWTWSHVEQHSLIGSKLIDYQ